MNNLFRYSNARKQLDEMFNCGNISASDYSIAACMLVYLDIQEC